MDKSCFTDKSCIPDDSVLQSALGNTFSLWKKIEQYLIEKNTGLKGEWHFPGEKYGWSYRIKDKKRAIIYLLPRDEFFKVAFVFGQKATERILKSNVSEKVKSELITAKIYAEGRGIRIEIKEDSDVTDVLKLSDIKTES